MGRNRSNFLDVGNLIGLQPLSALSMENYWSERSPVQPADKLDEAVLGPSEVYSVVHVGDARGAVAVHQSTSGGSADRPQSVNAL